MMLEKTAASILIGIGALQTITSASPNRLSHHPQHASLRFEADGHFGVIRIHFSSGDFKCRLYSSATNAGFGSHSDGSDTLITIYLGRDTS